MSDQGDKPDPPPGDHASPGGDRSYRLLFEANPLPMWVYDLQTLRILDVNEVACHNYGYTREEFLALTIRDLRPPEDVERMEESVRTMPKNVFTAGVWRHRLKDGRIIFVEITSHEMDFRGRRTRFVCPIDVTQRVRTEAALRDRERGLRRAQTMASLGHVISRRDGSFESWSESLPQIAGLSSVDMPRSTRDWLRLVHADDRAAVRAASQQAAALRARVDLEYRLTQPHGGQLHIRQAMEPIEDREPGERGCWFSTFQDITAQKEAEAQMKRLNDELERRVLERTLALEVSNRELARASEAAARANQAKSDFLSSMSHELRTPLNAIIGFGQLLAAPGGPGTSAEQTTSFVGHIVKAGRHLLTLINDVLDLAQIESGRVPVAIGRVPLAELLPECAAMVEPLAAQRGIRLRFPADLPQVLADRTRLKQVLLNLLSNAIKYNREHGSIMIDHAGRDGGRVRISVSDTGEGLRPEQMAQLFQPFNRLGRGTGDAEGTGLGLVVSKRMVELMGGDIGASSTPGIGSTFWVDLPAPAGRLADDAAATVLVVEDDPASLQLVQQVLSGRPALRLLTATNGREGVELARAHRPTLILMDNNMPEMSGREARALLQADERTADIPVIALSGGPPPSDRVEPRPRNSDLTHLAKPIDPAALAAAVDDALHLARSRGLHDS